MVIKNIFVNEDSAQLNCVRIFICILKYVDLKYIVFFYCLRKECLQIFTKMYPSNFRYIYLDAESAQLKTEFLWV
jgi:hypothetical protein